MVKEVITSFEAANRVEELSFRTDGVAETLEILAERDTTSTSSVLWMLAEILREQIKDYEQLTQDLMETYRVQIGIKK